MYICAITLDPSTYESVLEVYHLPRDIWSKEMESLKSKLLKTDVAAAHEKDEVQQDQTVSEMFCTHTTLYYTI